MSLTEKAAKRLPQPVDVLEMDANDPAQIDRRAPTSWRHAGGQLDGFLHAIAFAPQDALGGNFLNTPWESVATAIQTSAYSLKAIARRDAAADARARWRDRVAGLRRAGRVAGLRLDGRREGRARGRHALPRARPRSARDPREHGARPGRCGRWPGKGIPGFQALADGWDARAPLGWDMRDAEPVAGAIAFLLSDLARGHHAARWSTSTGVTTRWARPGRRSEDAATEPSGRLATAARRRARSPVPSAPSR